MKFQGKMWYFFICCISLVLIIIGATFAYFTASISDENTVYGDSATVSFSLGVRKITSIDMAFGLIPMKNNQSPNAAAMKCLDDWGNAGCQMYEITVSADSDTVMFLDGYVVITPRNEKLETRFTSIYTDDEGENFHTGYTNEDMASETFIENEFIKSGIRKSVEPMPLNNKDDFDCLLVKNQQIGGEEIGRTRVFYMMIWVYDNGEAQDEFQGLQLAYTGEVVFNTAEGNQISATFD